MAIDQYAALEDVKAAIRVKHDEADDLIELAIEAASRRIDEFCNDQFWLSPTPSARVLTPVIDYELSVGAFATTTGLTVEFDNDNDGTFETVVAGTAYQAAAPERAGHPYRRLEFLDVRLPGTGWRRVSSRPARSRVRVTAQWGWPAVPAQVRQACLLMALDHYRGKNFTNGVVGPPINSAGGSGAEQQHLSNSSPALNPIASMLLLGLCQREILVA